MHCISSRFGGLFAGFVVAVASAVGAAPASATVTHSSITTPTGGFFQNNLDSLDPQVIHIEGTSDGDASDHVDIVCIASSSSSTTVASDVEVDASGNFSKDAPYPTGSYAAGTCLLKAIPSGSNASSTAAANFTGPTINYGSFDSYSLSGGVNDGTTYDYDLLTSQPGGGAGYDSAGDCGLDQSALHFEGVGFTGEPWRQGPWRCDAYFPTSDGDLYGGSATVVDGHNAYLPDGASNINNSAPGMPAATITQSVDPSTGVMTATETDGLAYCANADDSIDDSFGPSTCDHWAPAPVKLTRTWVENHNGLQATLTDQWQSTDGASHPVRLQYQEDLGYCYIQMPGQRQNDCHASSGEEVALPSTAPATIYATWYPDEPSDYGQTGALTYMDKPDRVVYTNDEAFVRVYNRSVPASGALTEQTVYSMGYTRADAAQLAQAAQGATSAPTVTITSPAANAVVATQYATVTGKATDDEGVTSLTVNGAPTPVAGDGTWSQTVPLQPGANTVTAVAADSGGNATTVSERVVYSPPAAPSCVVPKVSGLSSNAAGAALLAAGCSVGKVTAAPSTKYAKGTVLRQSRAAGLRVSAFYPVDVVVSSGRPGRARSASTATLHGRTLRLVVSCAKTDGNACSGTISILINGAKAGSARYRIAQAHSSHVVVTLKAAAARLVHRHHRVHGQASFRGSARSSNRLTIKG